MQGKCHDSIQDYRHGGRPMKKSDLAEDIKNLEWEQTTLEGRITHFEEKSREIEAQATKIVNRLTPMAAQQDVIDNMRAEVQAFGIRIGQLEQENKRIRKVFWEWKSWIRKIFSP